jgi:hypothetical protein
MVRFTVADLEGSANAGAFLNKNHIPVLGNIYCNEIGGCCTVQMVNHGGFLSWR